MICNDLHKKSAVFLHYILYRFGPAWQTRRTFTSTSPRRTGTTTSIDLIVELAR
jgi:hypothetical protein